MTKLSQSLGSNRQRDSYQNPVRRTKELLKLDRKQLWWMTRLLTGHCHLKGQQNCAGNKQKSYKIMRMNMFAV
jgi:hypothetical protein